MCNGQGQIGEGRVRFARHQAGRLDALLDEAVQGMLDALGDAGYRSGQNIVESTPAPVQFSYLRPWL